MSQPSSTSKSVPIRKWMDVITPQNAISRLPAALNLQPPVAPYQQLPYTFHRRCLDVPHQEPPPIPYQQRPPAPYQQIPAAPYQHLPANPPIAPYQQPPPPPYQQPQTFKENRLSAILDLSESNSSSRSDSESSNDSCILERQNGKRKKHDGAKLSQHKRKKRSTPLSTKDKKIALRICVRDFEMYTHAKSKGEFWEHIQYQFKDETGKDHATIGKAVSRWVRDRQRVLKHFKEGKFSGEEEDDKEVLIALDEWISLLDSLELKPGGQEDRISKANENAAESEWIDEKNSSPWLGRQEGSTALQAHNLQGQSANGDLDGQSVDESFQTPLGSASPVCGHTSARTPPSRSLRRRVRRRPLGPQRLTQLAAGIRGLVTELKAGREGAARSGGVQEKELLRLGTEIKELLKSVDSRLAAFDEKTSVMLSILPGEWSGGKLQDREKENERG